MKDSSSLVLSTRKPPQVFRDSELTDLQRSDPHFRRLTRDAYKQWALVQQHRRDAIRAAQDAHRTATIHIPAVFSSAAGYVSYRLGLPKKAVAGAAGQAWKIGEKLGNWMYKRQGLHELKPKIDTMMKDIFIKHLKIYREAGYFLAPDQLEEVFAQVANDSDLKVAFEDRQTRKQILSLYHMQHPDLDGLITFEDDPDTHERTFAVDLADAPTGEGSPEEEAARLSEIAEIGAEASAKLVDAKDTANTLRNYINGNSDTLPDDDDAELQTLLEQADLRAKEPGKPSILARVFKEASFDYSSPESRARAEATHALTQTALDTADLLAVATNNPEVLKFTAPLRHADTAFHAIMKASALAANPEASLLLTGNAYVLGASAAISLVMSLQSSSSEPSFEELVMKQLQAIYKRIEALESNLLSRMDTMEENIHLQIEDLKAFNHRMFDMIEHHGRQLDRIERRLDSITGLLRDIHTSVIEGHISTILGAADSLLSKPLSDLAKLLPERSSLPILILEAHTRSRLSKANFLDAVDSVRVLANETATKPLITGRTLFERLRGESPEVPDTELIKLLAGPAPRELDITVGLIEYARTLIPEAILETEMPELAAIKFDTVPNISIWHRAVSAYIHIHMVGRHLSYGRISSMPHLLQKMRLAYQNYKDMVLAIRDPDFASHFLKRLLGETDRSLKEITRNEIVNAIERSAHRFIRHFKHPKILTNSTYHSALYWHERGYFKPPNIHFTRNDLGDREMKVRRENQLCDWLRIRDPKDDSKDPKVEGHFIRREKALLSNPMRHGADAPHTNPERMLEFAKRLICNHWPELAALSNMYKYLGRHAPVSFEIIQAEDIKTYPHQRGAFRFRPPADCVVRNPMDRVASISFDIFCNIRIIYDPTTDPTTDTDAGRMYRFKLASIRYVVRRLIADRYKRYRGGIDFSDPEEPESTGPGIRTKKDTNDYAEPPRADPPREEIVSCKSAKVGPSTHSLTLTAPRILALAHIQSVLDAQRRELLERWLNTEASPLQPAFECLYARRLILIHILLSCQFKSTDICQKIPTKGEIIHHLRRLSLSAKSSELGKLTSRHLSGAMQNQALLDELADMLQTDYKGLKVDIRSFFPGGEPTRLADELQSLLENPESFDNTLLDQIRGDDELLEQLPEAVKKYHDTMTTEPNPEGAREAMLFGTALTTTISEGEHRLDPEDGEGDGAASAHRRSEEAKTSTIKPGAGE